MIDQADWALSVLEETLGLPRQAHEELAAGISTADLAAAARLLAGSSAPEDEPRPRVNGLLERAFHDLVRARAEQRRPSAHVWYYPEPHPFALLLSHDVDELRWSWRRRLLMALRHPGAKPAAPHGYWNFERILAQEARWQVRSTFFACPAGSHRLDPPYSLSEAADVLRSLESQGWEIGVHGSYESFEVPGMLAAQREALAGSIRNPPAGVRQHYLNFRPGETWALQEGAGFAYDTSLGDRTRAGFRAGFCHPYRGPGRRLLEIPLTVMDSQLYWYERLSPEAAVERTRDLAGAAAEAHGVVCLNWHQHTWDDLSFPGWWLPYLQCTDQLLRRGPWVARGCDLASWWNRRLGIQVEERVSAPGSGVWALVDPLGGDCSFRVQYPEGGPWRIRVEGTEDVSVTPSSSGAMVALRRLPAGGAVRIEAFEA